MPDVASYQNVYDFSTNLTRGFYAEIDCLDGNQIPLPIASATMLLKRHADQVQEFAWTNTNNLISILNNGRLIINVAAAQMTPSEWITAPERYPYQLYDYILSGYDASPALLLSITGKVTIYQF